MYNVQKCGHQQANKNNETKHLKNNFKIGVVSRVPQIRSIIKV